MPLKNTSVLKVKKPKVTKGHINYVELQRSAIKKQDMAGALVGHEIALRKNDQSVNWSSLVIGGLIVIGIPFMWMELISKNIEGLNEKQNMARATMGINVSNTQVSPGTFYMPDYMKTVYPTATPTPTGQP